MIDLCYVQSTSSTLNYSSSHPFRLIVYAVWNPVRPYDCLCPSAAEEVGIILKGIDSFSVSTCIRFIPRTNQDEYILIQSLEGYVKLQKKKKMKKKKTFNDPAVRKCA